MSNRNLQTSKKKIIVCLISSVILVLFVFIILAIFQAWLILPTALVLIIGLGFLYRKHPECVDTLRKPHKKTEAISFTSRSLIHENTKHTYMMLVCLNASNQYRITIDKPHFIIGNSTDADYRLVDDFVSRKHALIDYKDDEKNCYITDCSTNGTFLNSVRLPQNKPYKLRQDDTLQIAGIAFLVEYVHF